jgi:hypothetical protein
MTTNGKPHIAAWLRLDFDQATFKLEVSGEFATIDVALAMLQQATRELEATQRIARAQQMQRAALEQAENERLASLITKRG